MKKEVFKAFQISDHVYWVGAIDWNLRDFHGYSTNRGTTYNAYLILSDKITLVDTVKAPFRDELMARISSVVNPKELSVIISNHSEMDHTGCLPGVIHLVKPDQVYASTMG
ncbi:FprA family A-type flavoprotein, partial [bacterium]|nr:FprA family A-type flavoprotein [bacterium]